MLKFIPYSIARSGRSIFTLLFFAMLFQLKRFLTCYTNFHFNSIYSPTRQTNRFTLVYGHYDDHTKLSHDSQYLDIIQFVELCIDDGQSGWWVDQSFTHNTHSRANRYHSPAPTTHAQLEF